MSKNRSLLWSRWQSAWLRKPKWRIKRYRSLEPLLQKKILIWLKHSEKLTRAKNSSSSLYITSSAIAMLLSLKSLHYKLHLTLKNRNTAMRNRSFPAKYSNLLKSLQLKNWSLKNWRRKQRHQGCKLKKLWLKIKSFVSKSNKSSKLRQKNVNLNLNCLSRRR